MNLRKMLCVIAILFSIAACITSCGKHLEDEDSIAKFNQGMNEYPVDYYVDEEMRCAELDFDSVENKVFALCYAHGFDLYAMDENGDISFINVFSDGEVLNWKKDGTVISHYYSNNIEVICVSLITDQGVFLIDTYAKKTEDGETHYYKGVPSIRKEYVGEKILSDREWVSINTAEMFLLDGKWEIKEKTYKKEIKKIQRKVRTLKYEEMVPYEGSNIYPAL